MNYSKCSSFLSGLFGQSIIVISWQQVEDGMNKHCHYFAETQDGKRFGFKATDGTKTHNGVKIEKLIWDLAKIVSAPFACEAYIVHGEEWMGPSLNGKDIIVTHWLEKAKPLKKIEKEEASEIENNCLWTQIGEWLVFCLAFRIYDRHLGNWLWSPTKQVLIISDTEMSLHYDIFGRDFSPILLFFPKLGQTIDLNPENRQNNPVFIKLLEGVKKMADNLYEYRENITNRLKKDNFYDYNSIWLNISSDEIISRIKIESFM